MPSSSNARRAAEEAWCRVQVTPVALVGVSAPEFRLPPATCTLGAPEARTGRCRRRSGPCFALLTGFGKRKHFIETY